MQWLVVIVALCVVCGCADVSPELQDIISVMEQTIKSPADLRMYPRDSMAQVNYTTVNTSLGAITGVIENGYRSFKGIPFSQPPINENRWSPPIPVNGKWME